MVFRLFSCSTYSFLWQPALDLFPETHYNSHPSIFSSFGLSLPDLCLAVWFSPASPLLYRSLLSFIPSPTPLVALSMPTPSFSPASCPRWFVSPLLPVCLPSAANLSSQSSSPTQFPSFPNQTQAPVPATSPAFCSSYFLTASSSTFLKWQQITSSTKHWVLSCQYSAWLHPLLEPPIIRNMWFHQGWGLFNYCL